MNEYLVVFYTFRMLDAIDFHFIGKVPKNPYYSLKKSKLVYDSFGSLI